MRPRFVSPYQPVCFEPYLEAQKYTRHILAIWKMQGYLLKVGGVAQIRITQKGLGSVIGIEESKRDVA